MTEQTTINISGFSDEKENKLQHYGFCGLFATPSVDDFEDRIMLYLNSISNRADKLAATTAVQLAINFFANELVEKDEEIYSLEQRIYELETSTK